MKVRSGFVTNSSSTCYLIAIPQNMRLYELFGVLAKIPTEDEGAWLNSDSNDYKIEYNTAQEAIDNFTCQYIEGLTEEEKEREKENTEKIKRAFEEGCRVYKINISYHGQDGISQDFHVFQKLFPNIMLINWC